MSRRLKYVLVGLSGLVLLLVTAALTIPFLFRDRLQALLQARVSAAIDADVQWASLDVSLIRGFPHLGLTAHGVRVCNRAPFDGVCLAEVDHVSASLAIFSLLRDTIDIRSLHVRHPVVRLLAREDGLANWQVIRPPGPAEAPAGPSPASSRLRLTLSDYRIDDAEVSYVDRGAQVAWEVAGFDHAGDGDFSPEALVFHTTTRADRASLSVKGVSYLRDAEVEATGAVRFDRVMQRIALDGARLRLNALTLGLDGTITPAGDDLALDLRWSSNTGDLGGIVSLLPASLVGDRQGLETSGAVELAGQVRGTWGEAAVPALDARLSVRDGRFKYGSLPAGVEAIAFEGAVTSPQAANWDQLVIDVPRFTARLAGQPFEGRLRLATLSTDPTVGAGLQGRLDLSDVPRVVPFPAGTTLAGHAEADIRLEGRLSALEHPERQRFAADGYLHVRDAIYRPASSNRELHATALSLTFNPRHLQLLTEGAGVGASDVTIRGRFEDYLRWWFGQGTLGGSFEVSGNAIDLAGFLRNEAPADGPPDQTAPALATIPDRLDLTIDASARRVSYGAIELGGVRGRLRLHERRAELHDLGFGLFGGTVTVNGAYDTRGSDRPRVQLSYTARGLDLQQAARLSSSLRAVAPVVVAALGTFDSTLDLTGALSPTLSLDLASLAGRGSVSSTNLRLNQFAPLTALARALKITSLDEAALGDVRFTFVLRDGRMITAPFDVRLGDLALRVGGSTAFATRAIDYDVTGRLPTSLFGADAPARVAEWLGPAAAEAVPALLGITARLTGTVAQPSVAIAFEAAGAASVARAAVLAEARAEAERLLARADEEAAAIRREADEAAARIRAEADQTAERLVAEANQPLARAAARLAAGRLRQEAAARADDLVQVAARRAEAVLDAARRAAAERVDAATPRSP